MSTNPISPSSETQPLDPAFLSSSVQKEEPKQSLSPKKAKGVSSITKNRESNGAICAAIDSLLEGNPYVNPKMRELLRIGNQVMNAKSENQTVDPQLIAQKKLLISELSTELPGLFAAVSKLFRALASYQETGVNTTASVSKSLTSVLSNLSVLNKDNAEQLSANAKAIAESQAAQAGCGKLMLVLNCILGAVATIASFGTLGPAMALTTAAITVATTVPVHDGMTPMQLGVKAIATDLEKAGMDSFGAEAIANTVMLVAVVACSAAAGGVGATEGGASAASAAVEESGEDGIELAEMGSSTRSSVTGSSVTESSVTESSVTDSAESEESAEADTTAEESTTNGGTKKGAIAGAKYGVMMGLGSANPISPLISEIIYQSSVHKEMKKDEKEKIKEKAEMIGNIVGSVTVVAATLTTAIGPTLLGKLGAVTGSESLTNLGKSAEAAFDFSPLFREGGGYRTSFPLLNRILNSPTKLDVISKGIDALGKLAMGGAQIYQGINLEKVAKYEEKKGNLEALSEIIESVQKETQDQRNQVNRSTQEIFSLTFSLLDALGKAFAS